jgi:hypothetical protein
MKLLAKRLVVLLTAGVIFLFAVQTYPVASVRTSVSTTEVYVCTGTGGDWPCATNPYGRISFEGSYIPQVLANEWPGAAGDQALRAGAIAIRTFGWRYPLGCGAVWGYKTVGGTDYRIEHNIAQRYWLPGGGQNTIQSKHTNAVNATSGMVMRRYSDNDYACAKYKADCGNPTADGGEEPNTLISVPDPVDTKTTIASGMSQNGTHAWELSGYAGAAPLEYRQMFTHYYANIYMYGLSFYRWTWLDVDTAGGTRYGDYYGPFAHTPLTMQTGRAYLVPFHVQNTSCYNWNNSGSYPERLSYHWYTSGGSLVTWDGLRTSLGRDVPPADDLHLQAKSVF